MTEMQIIFFVFAFFIFSAANILVLFYLGKKFAERADGILNRITLTSHSVRCDLWHIQSWIDMRLEKIRGDINSAHDTVKSQAGELNARAHEVKTHAQQIIDARGQHDNQAAVRRAKCSSCHHVVYKFEQGADGVTCIDCLSRK